MGYGVGRTIGPVELREAVQLDRAAKNVTVERQGLTSGAGEQDVRLRVRHASNLSNATSAGTLLKAEDGFLDVAVPRVGVGVLGSDDDEARLLEDPERGDVVAGRPGVQRPDRDQREQEFQGLAGDSASPGPAVDPVGDLGLVSGREAGDAADDLPVPGDR